MWKMFYFIFNEDFWREKYAILSEDKTKLAHLYLELPERKNVEASSGGELSLEPPPRPHWPPQPLWSLPTLMGPEPPTWASCDDPETLSFPGTSL